MELDKRFKSIAKSLIVTCNMLENAHLLYPLFVIIFRRYAIDYGLILHMQVIL